MTNLFVGIGRITNDITLNKTQTGKSVVSFNLAINRRYDKDKADFINCVAWGPTAEFMDKYLRKGALICVEGEVQTRSYDDKEGRRVYVTEVVTSNVQGLERKEQREETSYTPEPSYETEQEDDLVLDITSDDLPF